MLVFLQLEKNPNQNKNNNKNPKSTEIPHLNQFECRKKCPLSSRCSLLELALLGHEGLTYNVTDIFIFSVSKCILLKKKKRSLIALEVAF